MKWSLYSVVSLVLLLICGDVRAEMLGTFELRPRQRVTFGGAVMEKDKAKDAGVDFGVIPKSSITLKPYYNVFTGMVENRPAPGNPHPIPVLRGAHVQAFVEKPDLSKLALDQVSAYGNEAQLHSEHKFVIFGDGKDMVRLISFDEVTLPQDKDGSWILKGKIESLKLVAHFDDPIADKGRAVLASEPLPIKGRLIFGTRKFSYGPGALHTVTLPDGKPQKWIETTEPRVALNGAVVDRVDMRTLVVTDKNGKETAKISLDPNEAAQFTISTDGEKIAVSMERLVDVPDSLPRREIATLVFDSKGNKLGEIVGYDDPAFMPDGRLLLTGRGGEPGLYLGDYKTGKAERIEIKEGPKTEDEKNPWWPRMPAVSPDGKRVAYVSGRGVYVVGIDGTDWTPVWISGTDPEPQTVPTWSPDGSLLAVNIIPLNVMTGPGKVSVFDLKKKVRQVLENTQGADSDTPMVWQP